MFSSSDDGCGGYASAGKKQDKKDKREVSFLCLLNLSAAFDTLDYFILLTRLSTWFGISISLSWFRSYLSFSSSSVSIIIIII